MIIQVSTDLEPEANINAMYIASFSPHEGGTIIRFHDGNTVVVHQTTAELRELIRHRPR